ncbi:MAG: type III secretion system export apparatus subunit SctV [Acidobacteriota bacterium]
MIRRLNLDRMGRHLTAGDLTAVLTRYSDILLAVLVMAIIGIVMVPLPPFVLDLFLATSLAIGVTILMITLYVPNALALASFPTIILVATLLRLSLNLASTKLILLDGYAGEVIKAFGRFVVQGDYVVGFVVFVMVTIIQFVVIAKGAERVSEVSARFTLDALPGKQMAIDADLRAGIIDANEARRRRDLLGRESQFYGAMDGAMKFVKGDTIAGIVISLINIVAGLGIGVLGNGMAVGDAARRYTLLTVGDGLVSQVPSLILATAAGIITTRVASKAGEESSLGREIGTQILAQPKAISIASVLLLAIALIPGLPMVPFLVLAAVLSGFAWTVFRMRKQKDRESLRAKMMDAPGADAEDRDLPMTVPILVEASASLTPVLDVGARGNHFVQRLIPQTREWLFQELGVHLPGVRVRGESDELEPNAYRVHLHEVPVAKGTALPDRLFVGEGAEDLVMLGVDGVPGVDPETGAKGVWVKPEDADSLRDVVGDRALRADAYITRHLRQVLREKADRLLSVQDVQSMLEALDSQGYGALINSIVPQRVPLQRLTEVFRRLLREDLSIRNLPAILEALAEWASPESDPSFLAECARSNLKPYIGHRFSSGGSVLCAYLLDPQIEELLRDALRSSPGPSVMRLDPDTQTELVRCFARVLGEPSAARGSGERPILLTQSDVRAHVRQLLSSHYPRVVVLSFQELPAELRVQPLNRVTPSSALLDATRPSLQAA